MFQALYAPHNKYMQNIVSLLLIHNGFFCLQRVDLEKPFLMFAVV